MSRQEVARAALRSLTSHAEEEEVISREAQQYPFQYQQHQSQSQQPASTSSSYFGGSALQITDSPSSSPNLAASHPHQFDSLPRSARRVGDNSIGTPGASDVPSLSLSNSSYSDGPLRSPFNEHAPSQNSISSIRTVQQHNHVPLDEEERREADVLPEVTIRRVASNMQMSFDDVRRVERCMTREVQESGLGQSQEEELMDDLGRERFYKVVEAVRAEEERLSQLNSFRSAYLRAESLRTDLEYQQNHSSTYSHATSIHSPVHSRSIPFSPPPSYDQLDLWDRSAPIPSPRAALESLTASSNQGSSGPLSSSTFESSRANSNRHSYWNTSTSPYHTHSRQTSAGARPVSLPDRSYRSMDDYTPQLPQSITSPLLKSGANLPIRRSIHGAIPSPAKRSSISRQASRSPLIGSPKLLEDDGMETEESGQSYSPQVSASQHLRPGATNSRQRSASNNDYDGVNGLTKASRRASAEVLGQSIKRTSSPLVISENSSGLSASSSQPLSHEEVMARLQRKVRERLAARNGGQDYTSSNVIVGGRSNIPLSATSPTLSKHSSLPYGTQPTSIGRSGRRRQGSLAGQVAPASAKRSTSANTRKPRKSASLKTLAKEAGLNQQHREEGKEEQGEEEQGEEDSKMEDVVIPYDGGTAGMGIEALLSAAAIADSPRIGLAQ